MDAEVKKLWIKTLQSGMYKKGRGTMVKECPKGQPDEFCCLGVLQNIAIEQGVYDGIYDENYPPLWSGFIMDQVVFDWAGADLTLHQHNLARLNDKPKVTTWRNVIQYIRKEIK